MDGGREEERKGERERETYKYFWGNNAFERSY